MSGLLTRKRTVLAKIESVYGTDSMPDGSNAIVIKNLNIKPIQASTVSRDIIRPYLGISELLLASKSVEIDFEVENVGSGTLGLAPAFDCLLRASAFSKSTTLTTISIACVARACTVTLTAHGLAVGDKFIVSGCTDTHKNGTFTVLTAPDADTFTYQAAVSATDESPAAGSPKLNAAVVYSPISTGFESVTIYFNVDGVRHILTGVRATMDVSIVVKQIPTLKFTCTGLYNAPTDAAAPSVDFSSFQIPQVVNTQNTQGFSLFSYSGAMESFALQMANDVQYITLVGEESVKLLDRQPAGTIVFEAPTIGTKDFFSLISSNTKGPFSVSHGLGNGFKFELDAPSVHLSDATYQDSNGVQMLSCPFQAVPSTSGNDELTITYK